MNIPNLSVSSVFTAHIIIGGFDVCWSEMKRSELVQIFSVICEYASVIECFKIVNRKHMAYSEPRGIFDVQWKWYRVFWLAWQLLIMNRICQKFKMKMAATMSSQRKRKRSEKQDNTGRHQLYDWTKRTRKFSLKWKDDFPRDSLEENNRICQRSWQWQARNLRRKCNIAPRICGGLRYDYAKFSALYALEILNVMRDLTKYISVFSQYFMK